MYCRNCGQELNENDRVCPACGTPVVKNESVNEEQNTASEKATAQGAPHTGQRTYEYNADKTASQSTYNYSGADYQPSSDTGSAGWGILGCCLPLIGLILFLVWKDSKPLSAKKAGIGALVGFIAGILLYVLVLVLGVGAALVGYSSGQLDIDNLEQYLEETTDILTNVFTRIF